MNDTLKYVSFKRVMKILNLFFHLLNMVTNPVETCIDVVETSANVEVHSLNGIPATLGIHSNIAMTL